MMTFNPYDAQINPYGLADWYRYQNLGYQIPLVGGSDKMAASSLLGGIRTYAHLGERELHVRALDGGRARRQHLRHRRSADRVRGRRASRPAAASTSRPAAARSTSTWTVESVSVPIDQVEVIAGGLVAEQVNAGERLARQRQRLGARSPTRPGSRCACAAATAAAQGDIAAHTSAVQVVVGDKPLFVETDAMAVLEQIEGAHRLRRHARARARRRNATSSCGPRWRAPTTGCISGCIGRASSTGTRPCMGMTRRRSTESWHSDDCPCLRFGCQQREGGWRAIRRMASARSGGPPLPQRSRARVQSPALGHSAVAARDQAGDRRGRYGRAGGDRKSRRRRLGVRLWIARSPRGADRQPHSLP